MEHTHMSQHSGSLFNDLPLPEEVKGLVKIPGSSNRLDPAQRTFNRLTDQVRRLRDEVAQWQKRLDDLRQRGRAKLLPLLDAMQQAQIELIKQIDTLLTQPSQKKLLTRKRRDALGQYLLWLLEPIIRETPDPELIAIYDRHSVLTHAENAEFERELARGLLGDLYGEEILHGLEGDNLEEMLEQIQARLDERERTRATGKPTRKAQRLAEIQQAAEQAVRETYRKLASHLHPDRETDPAARQRKTELMQRANKAYEENDLLTLLALQLECEQLDADRMAEIPAERIERFNHALREQVRALEMEKREVIQHLASLLDVDPRKITATNTEDRLFDQRLQTVCHQLEVLRARSEALADPARRREAIDAIVDELCSFEEAMGIDELAWIREKGPLNDAPQPRRPGRRRKKRR